MERNDMTAALAGAVQTLIVQGHRRISARLDLTRVQILAEVAAEGPVRPATIAGRLALTKSTVSRHLTALQEAGQIRVRADAADARTFLAEITPEGELDRARTADVGAAQFGRAIAHWTDSEVSEACRVVQRLLDAWAPDSAPDRTKMPPNGAGVTGPRWMHRRVTEESADAPTESRESTR